MEMKFANVVGSESLETLYGFWVERKEFSKAERFEDQGQWYEVLDDDGITLVVKEVGK